MIVESNLKNEDDFLSGFWGWAWANSCFHTKDGKDIGIQISDVDGHVERNGHFLWIEGTRNDQLKLGPMRSLKHRILKGDTAVLLFGEPNTFPIRTQIYRPHIFTPKEYSLTQENLWKFFRGWMLWAEANGYVDSLT